ncbi:hypothetical protein GCM10010193_62600 [Kitasatospora atroaurantiaca]
MVDLTLAEEAVRLVRQEHRLRLVPGRGQQRDALADLLVTLVGLAEVDETAPRVHGQVGRAHPGAPSWWRAGRGVQRPLRRPQVAVAGETLAERGVGAGLAREQQGAGGGVLGAHESVGEDVDGGVGSVEPDVLVGEVVNAV